MSSHFFGQVFLHHFFPGLLRQDLEVDYGRHDERSSHLPGVVLSIHSHHKVGIGHHTHGVSTEGRERDKEILESVWMMEGGRQERERKKEKKRKGGREGSEGGSEEVKERESEREKRE